MACERVRSVQATRVNPKMSDHDGVDGSSTGINSGRDTLSVVQLKEVGHPAAE